MRPLTLTHCACANALGLGLAATFDALRDGRSGLRPNDFEGARIKTWIGRIDGLETQAVTGGLAEWDCRNNRLAQLGLRQDGFEPAVAEAAARYGAARIGVVVGTTTSGILETERAYRRRHPTDGSLPPGVRYRCAQNLFSAADFVRRHLGLEGPALAVSTACSSSAKVFATAARFIQAGLCDAVVAGGVDSLCLTTLCGFNSLGLLSDGPCRPCDAARNGLSIGEAAGFVLVDRRPPRPGEIALLGYGESSDAYHMSSPHPRGDGAALAMGRALARAGITPAEVDYVNLHGTGSPANDRAEDQAVCQIFGEATPCSATKGWTGHTLGAAGITEAIITVLALRHDFLPGTLQTQVLDPALRSRILHHGQPGPLRCAVSNSFGFGGNNCSLVLGKTP